MIITIKKRTLKNYNGVEFVAYDKEYTDEALDNDEYDILKSSDAIIINFALTPHTCCIY